MSEEYIIPIFDTVLVNTEKEPVRYSFIKCACFSTGMKLIVEDLVDKTKNEYCISCGKINLENGTVPTTHGVLVIVNPSKLEVIILTSEQHKREYLTMLTKQRRTAYLSNFEDGNWKFIDIIN